MKEGKKRICIVTPCHWSGSFGGSEQQISLLLEALTASEKYDITYLAREADPQFKPSGYKIEKIKFRRSTMRVGNMLDAVPLLRKLSQIRPDVIYQRVGGAYTGVSAYYAKKNRCRMVWHIACDTNVQPLSMQTIKSSNVFSRYLEKKVLEYGLENCSSIIAQTAQQAEMLFRYYGKTSKVIPNFQPVPPVPDKSEWPIKVIWVANLKVKKRPEVFLQLARDFKAYKDVQFLMIGRASGDAWCRELIASVNDIETLKYLGEKTQDEVNNLLSDSHIFVNTSMYEGFPNTFIQAWMRQVPVVSLDVDPDRIFETNNIGYCAGSYENLRDKLGQLIRDRNLRATMGVSAREHAIKKHSGANIQSIIQELSA